jgi:hypothetical protein
VTDGDPGRRAPSGAAADAPATLAWAVRLLFVEAAALAVLTAYLVVQDITADPTDRVVAIALTVFAAFGAVAVAALGRSLGRRSAAARGPAIVVQLMLMVLSYYMLKAELWWLGVPLLLLGLTATVLIVLPPTTRALGLDPRV